MSDEAIQKITGPLAVPDFLKDQHGGQGFEGMSPDDVILPRLGFCQSMTPQRKKTDPSFIEGLSEGDLFNSVSGEIYGQAVKLIPLAFKKARIFFRPLSEGGGMLCQSPNGIDGGTIAKTCAECPNSKFSANGDPPVCSLFYNYPAILLPFFEVLVVSLKSTALKAGKNWNTRMKLMGDKPMFAGAYDLKLVEQKNSKGTYFGPIISFSRFVTQEEFNVASSLYDTLRNKNIVADDTGLDHEEDEPPEF